MLHRWMLVGISPDGVCACVCGNLSSSVFVLCQMYLRSTVVRSHNWCLLYSLWRDFFFFAFIQTQTKPTYTHTHIQYVLTCAHSSKCVCGFFLLFFFFNTTRLGHFVHSDVFASVQTSLCAHSCWFILNVKHINAQQILTSVLQQIANIDSSTLVALCF